jgi:hypothetical protein
MLGPAFGQVKPASSSRYTERRGHEFIVSEAVAEPSLGVLTLSFLWFGSNLPAA